MVFWEFVYHTIHLLGCTQGKQSLSENSHMEGVSSEISSGVDISSGIGKKSVKELEDEISKLKDDFAKQIDASNKNKTQLDVDLAQTKEQITTKEERP